MKIIRIALMAFFMCVSFISCKENNDDNENSVSNGKFSIVGIWEECNKNGVLSSYERFHFEFKKNGTFIWYIVGEEEYSESGKYNYKKYTGKKPPLELNEDDIPIGIIELDGVDYYDDPFHLTGYVSYNNGLYRDGIMKISWFGDGDYDDDDFLFIRVE